MLTHVEYNIKTVETIKKEKNVKGGANNGNTNLKINTQHFLDLLSKKEKKLLSNFFGRDPYNDKKGTKNLCSQSL